MRLSLWLWENSPPFSLCVAGLFDMEGMMEGSTVSNQPSYHSDDEDDTDGECCSRPGLIVTLVL